MAQNPLSFRTNTFLGVASVIALILIYTLVSQHQHSINPKDLTIPSWTQLASGVNQAFEMNQFEHQRWIVTDICSSAYRYFLGLGVGILISVVLGVLMGCSGYFEAFLNPPLSIFAKIPPTAMLAVFFVSVGTDINMYIAMIAFGMVPNLAQVVYLAVKEVPEELLFKAQTLGASPFEVIWYVIVPHAFPKILDAVRLQIGPALVYLIAAEWIAAPDGFGYRIRMQQGRLNMSLVYPYLALLAGFGFLADYTLKWFREWTCPWYLAE